MASSNENLKLTFQIQLTTWPQTFEDGKNVLEIAKLYPEKSRLLSACACILMAAALDQAAWAKLVYITNDWSDPKTLPKKYTGLLDSDGTFRKRIDSIPDIMTEGRLQLNRESSQVKSLYQLIRLRNALVHIRDSMKEGEVEIAKADFSSGKIGNLGIQPPLYPWAAVCLKDAEAFRDAVSMYLSDVIEAESIKLGPIIMES